MSKEQHTPSTIKSDTSSMMELPREIQEQLVYRCFNVRELAQLARTNKALSELAKSHPDYEVEKQKRYVLVELLDEPVSNIYEEPLKEVLRRGFITEPKILKRAELKASSKIDVKAFIVGSYTYETLAEAKRAYEVYLNQNPSVGDKGKRILGIFKISLSKNDTLSIEALNIIQYKTFHYPITLQNLEKFPEPVPFPENQAKIEIIEELKQERKQASASSHNSQEKSSFENIHNFFYAKPDFPAVQQNHHNSSNNNSNPSASKIDSKCNIR